MRIALLGLAVAILSIGLPATGVISQTQGWLLTGLALVLIVVALLPTPVTRAITRRVPWLSRQDRAREAVAALIASANVLHGSLSAAGLPDVALDAIADAWYQGAQNVLRQHAQSQLPAFQSDRTYLHMTRRGMSERQTFLLQWLEDRTDRLIALHRSL